MPLFERLPDESDSDYIARATASNKKLQISKNNLEKYHKKRQELGIINKNTQFTKKTITNM